MSQKIYTNLDIKGNTKIGDIANATSDTDKFLVSDAGVVKYRTGSEMLSDLGVAPGVASNVQHQVKAGVAINKGQAVYVTSADGTNMIVGLASNTSEATSSKTMGLLDNTVAINGFANVVTEGLLAGLNTIGSAAGDPVWLGTNGNLIYGLANKPSAPDHLVFIGIVTRVNANNGEIFVKVQNGFELNEIHDVDLKSSTPIGNQILAFEGAPINLWKNKTIPSVLGYTPVPTTRTITINGNTQDLSANLSFSIASGVTSFNTRTGAITLTTGDVTGALGYTPYNASNPAGYISSYTETDTLASVTGRGASTSTAVTLSSGGNTFNGHHYFSAYDANGNHYPHYNSGSNNNGSKLNLRMFDNSGNAVLFYLNGSDKSIQWNGNNIWHAGNLTNLNQLANGPGYITSYTETDPTVPSHVKAITTTNISNWNTAFGWGNHASAGYALSNHTHIISPVAESSVSPNGISIQAGPGSGNAQGWLYPYGTKLSAITGAGRSFEIMSTTYPDGQLVLRTLGSGGTWDSWKTILDTSNYSTYAVPAARTITINGTTQDLSANRSFTVTANAVETDTLATVTARGNTSTGDVNINGKIRVGSFPNSTTNNGEAWLGRAADRLAGTMTVQLGGNLDRKFEVVDYGWTTVLFSINGYGASYASGSFRAPTFYDSNDSGYYWDPATDTSHRFQTPNGYIDIGPKNSSYCHIYTDRGSFYFNAQLEVLGNRVLNAGNYNNYSPTLTGGNASGTWGINITGGSGSVSGLTLNSSSSPIDPNNVAQNQIGYQSGTNLFGQGDGGLYSSAYSSSWIHQIQGDFRTGQIAVRGKNSGSWQSWRTVLDSGNFSSYAWPVEGGWKPASLASSTRLRGATSPDGGEFALAYSGGQIHPYTDGFFYQNEGQYRVIDSNSISSQSVNYANSAGSASSASYASYLPTAYAGGQQLNPQVYFNNGIGVKAAMTAKVGVWSDTLWINGYSGGDVPWMCALHTQRNSTPRMYISAQYHTATSYGTAYEFLTEYNVADYAVTKNTGQDITGIKYFVSNRNTSSDSCPLQAYSNNGSGATMSFHRGGYYAVNFGLDSDNVIRIGGWSAGTNRLQMDMSGNLTMAGDVTAYSDRRVKENIITVGNALEKVNALRGVYYNRTDSEDKKTKLGVIAQEILEVVPEVVGQDNDGMYNVSYGNLAGLFIEAIKEQQKQIEELKELVNKLTKE